VSHKDDTLIQQRNIIIIIMIFRALSLVAQSLYRRTTATLGANSHSSMFSLTFRQQPQLQLADMPTSAMSTPAAAPSMLQDLLQDLSIWWMAVPKQKVSRHKKRLKTTLRNRIKLRHDIVVDARTGETTTRHKMPANWKDYLPKIL
jgi:ribosomal protein L32